jgi:hypothetical protein
MMKNCPTLRRSASAIVFGSIAIGIVGCGGGAARLTLEDSIWRVSAVAAQ